jgi:hypothetical protein
MVINSFFYFFFEFNNQFTHPLPFTHQGHLSFLGSSLYWHNVDKSHRTIVVITAGTSGFGIASPFVFRTPKIRHQYLAPHIPTFNANSPSFIFAVRQNHC